MWDKLEQINKRYEEIVAQMSNPEIATDHVQMTKLAQEKSSLDGIISLYQDYKATKKSLEDTKAMMDEKLDAEMMAMAPIIVGVPAGETPPVPRNQPEILTWK